MTGIVNPVHKAWPGLIEAYRDRLAIGDNWKTVTLREGGTPLLPAGHLSEITGCDVYLKVEGLNPTGSFKDRGMTMAVTDAWPVASVQFCARPPATPPPRPLRMQPRPA